jgi:para-nitrobenzyl esterase
LFFVIQQAKLNESTDIKNGFKSDILDFVPSHGLHAQENHVDEQVVTVAEGRLKGIRLASGVSVFKGIPYAAAPVGNLRWKMPMPLTKWSGIKTAIEFGPRPMQKSNMMYEFRSKKTSEDCLYLNVWAPKREHNRSKPVYVFIHGVSFVRGDGSQPSYDGESMAKKGIIYITINYRLGIFGFMAHPDLSEESGYASGNYGLLDQLAALKWVKKNVSAFGGDPQAITIGGESVGAQSVSAHMASPLSKGLFTRAIAESGSILDFRSMISPLEESEKIGLEVSKAAKADGIQYLRSLSAKELLKIANRGNPRRFIPTIDGNFLKENPLDIFRKRDQAQVPLLEGWNTDEVPYFGLFRLRRITSKNYLAAIAKFHGDKSPEVAALYPATTRAELKKCRRRIYKRLCD